VNSRFGDEKSLDCTHNKSYFYSGFAEGLAGGGGADGGGHVDQMRVCGAQPLRRYAHGPDVRGHVASLPAERAAAYRLHLVWVGRGVYSMLAGHLGSSAGRGRELPGAVHDGGQPREPGRRGPRSGPHVLHRGGRMHSAAAAHRHLAPSADGQWGRSFPGEAAAAPECGSAAAKGAEQDRLPRLAAPPLPQPQLPGPHDHLRLQPVRLQRLLYAAQPAHLDLFRGRSRVGWPRGTGVRDDRHDRICHMRGVSGQDTSFQRVYRRYLCPVDGPLASADVHNGPQVGAAGISRRRCIWHVHGRLHDCVVRVRRGADVPGMREHHGGHAAAVVAGDERVHHHALRLAAERGRRRVGERGAHRLHGCGHRHHRAHPAGSAPPGRSRRRRRARLARARAHHAGGRRSSRHRRRRRRRG
ncbi:Protein of unknown function, partial [Gryllus bimaculatus]